MASRKDTAQPLRIESVNYIEADSGHVIVRLTGRWSIRSGSPKGRVLLLVDVDGRNHRFPPRAERRATRAGDPWTASFVLPSWLKAHLGGGSLLIDDATVPLPEYADGGLGGRSPRPGGGLRTVGRGRRLARLTAEVAAASSRAGEVVAQAPRADESGEDAAAGDDAPPESSRSGDAVAEGAGPDGTGSDSSGAPAAGLAEAGGSGRKPPPGGAESAPPSSEAAPTIEALRAELRERASAEGRLRGLLADAQAELKARSAAQKQLEATQAHLRRELERLLGLIEQEDAKRAGIESKAVVLAAQVAELEAQVAEVTASRDQVSAELAKVTKRESGRHGELEAEVSRLQAELAQRTIASEAAASEAAGLREELKRLGAELAQAREQLASHGGGLGEAVALLEEVRDLNARLGAR